MHTSYLSPIYSWRKNRSCGYVSCDKSESSPHVGEFQILHTTDVEKSEMLPNLEEFQISPHERCEEILNLTCFSWQICFVGIYLVLKSGAPLDF